MIVVSVVHLARPGMNILVDVVVHMSGELTSYYYGHYAHALVDDGV
jgi:hypothetical protein